MTLGARLQAGQVRLSAPGVRGQVRRDGAVARGRRVHRRRDARAQRAQAPVGGRRELRDRALVRALARRRGG